MSRCSVFFTFSCNILISSLARIGGRAPLLPCTSTVLQLAFCSGNPMVMKHSRVFLSSEIPSTISRWRFFWRATVPMVMVGSSVIVRIAASNFRWFVNLRPPIVVKLDMILIKRNDERKRLKKSEYDGDKLINVKFFIFWKWEKQRLARAQV